MRNPANDPGRPGERAEKILVVDDDFGFRDMMSFCLEQTGYTVSTASDGIEALEVLAKQHPDLVILDVMMPGLDGYEVLRRMQADPATTAQVIVVSASPDVDIARISVAAYLAKPFGSSQLLWMVERVLSHAHQQASIEPRSLAA